MSSNDDLALTSPCPCTSHSAASDTVADGEPEDQHIATTARACSACHWQRPHKTGPQTSHLCSQGYTSEFWNGWI